MPIKVGIAGDRYFEVLSGLKDGDQVITGPYNSVRGMADGDQVKVEEPEAGRRTADRRRPAATPTEAASRSASVPPASAV